MISHEHYAVSSAGAVLRIVVKTVSYVLSVLTVVHKLRLSVLDHLQLCRFFWLDPYHAAIPTKANKPCRQLARKVRQAAATIKLKSKCVERELQHRHEHDKLL